MANEPPVQVRFAPAFLKDIKRLRKKYPHIQQDVQPLIDQLINGATPGDHIQATGYTVYKVRLVCQTVTRSAAKAVATG